MLDMTKIKGLKIEPWILKDLKGAKTIVIRFYNGNNILEIEDKNEKRIQYDFTSTYEYTGDWVMLYLNQSDSTEKAILSTLRKGDVIDFYPRLNGCTLMDKAGLTKTELLLTVKRFKRNSDVLQKYFRFILDDEISSVNGYQSIKSGLDYKAPFNSAFSASLN